MNVNQHETIHLISDPGYYIGELPVVLPGIANSRNLSSPGA